MKKTPSLAVRKIVQREICRQLVAFIATLKTKQDLALHLNCTVRTFDRRREAWKFPKPLINSGNFVRWTPEQILAWENQRRKRR